MLDSIITSKTRVKLLLKFLLNSETKSYLRGLENEFGESSNAIRVELNRLEEAGILVSEIDHNKKYFRANTRHPMFDDIHNILKKNVGIDQIIERIIAQIGNLQAAYITGDFAIGHESKIIDLVLIGQNLDTNYISSLVAKAETLIKRKIRHLELTSDQMKEYFQDKPTFLIWKQEI